jgi:predicted phage-related endonuclease
MSANQPNPSAVLRIAFGPDGDPHARAAWLAARRTMVTASDVPAILGIDPFKSAYSVWCEKTGVLDGGKAHESQRTSSLGVPFAEGGADPTSADPTAETVPGSIHLDSGDDPISEAVLWGNLLEPAVAQETAKRLGRSIRDHGRHTLFARRVGADGVRAIVVRRELVPVLVPGQVRIGCTPDREITARSVTNDPPVSPSCALCRAIASRETSERALGALGARGGHTCAGALEAKTFGSWADPLDEWRSEGPARFVAQLQIQMFVLGFRWGVLAGLQGGQRLVYHVHEYNPRFIGYALGAISEFWRFVEDRREPPVDAHPATGEALGERFRAMRAGPDSSVALSSRALMASAQLEIIAGQERVNAVARAECENVIKQELGDAEYGMADDSRARIRWQQVTPTKATSCPECSAVVRAPSKPYRKLTGPWSSRAED